MIGIQYCVLYTVSDLIRGELKGVNQGYIFFKLGAFFPKMVPEVGVLYFRTFFSRVFAYLQAKN